MHIFFPTLETVFHLNNDAQFKLVTNKHNAKFLHSLNLLPGCLPLSAWQNNPSIQQNIDVTLPKGTAMFIEKIGKEMDVHFSVFLDNKQYKFALPLSEINNLFDVSYGYSPSVSKNKP